MKKIYLAVSYSDNPRKAFKTACRIAGRLMSEGNIVFSPISHSHPIYKRTRKLLPNDTNFWLKQDLPFIEFCDELYIVRLPGWTISRGVQAEIMRAKELNKPIIFYDVI